MLHTVNSTTLDVIRSTTTLVSGACSYVCLFRRDRLKPGSIFDVLKEHTAFNAAYNSSERESEHASTCQEGTREDIMSKISAWVKINNDRPICWLEGPAGSGKSTVAHTIAKQCTIEQQLAASFFFSRGKGDRSDTTKFFPTFAYQLASFLPAIQTSMQCTLATDSSIPFQCLEDQIKKLIVNPILTIAEPYSSMIVIIDGLDECGGHTDLVQELIRLLVDTTHQLPFRFLFTSRPEAHIQKTFKSPSIQSKTYNLSLRDYNAHDDIRKYLQLRLSNIRDDDEELMQDIPRPWPSQEDLGVLVEQSDGLFIYVSTLLRFVADGNGLPQQKLEVAMRAHTGVDPLYDQVLSEARKFDQFERVIGAIIFLRQFITVRQLEQFLQLQSGAVRLALRGCQSILVINDEESVRPYHASLRDFLGDSDRAKKHFLDAMKHHVALLVDCLKLIVAHIEDDMKGGEHLDYAYQNWCYHFSLTLLHGGALNYIDSCLGDQMETFMVTMQQKWLKLWIYNLGGFGVVEAVGKDCGAVLERMAVGLFILRIGKYLTDVHLTQHSPQWKSVMNILKQIQNVVEVCELMEIFNLMC